MMKNEMTPEALILTCRPEIDDVDYWAEQLLKKFSVDELDQHCLQLTMRRDTLMDQMLDSQFEIGSAEYSLELTKVAEVSNCLEAVETALKMS